MTDPQTIVEGMTRADERVCPWCIDGGRVIGEPGWRKCVECDWDELPSVRTHLEKESKK